MSDITVSTKPVDDRIVAVGESPRHRFFRRFRNRPGAVVAAVFLVLIAVLGLLAPLIAPHDPIVQELTARRLPPLSDGYLLGTDNLGRDTLSRLLYGARVAVSAALISVSVGLLIGVVPALIAGFLGGWWDTILSRVADAFLSFPPLLLAMAIVGVMGTNLTNAMIAIGIVFGPRFFRVVRGAVIGVRESTFIEASRSIGTPTARIVRMHVLPHTLSPLIVQISLACGFALLAESSLSFLGLGVQPPEASWGRMLAEGREAWNYTAWPVVIPALTIILAVLACNTLGDGIRDSVGRENRSGQ
ncbi:MULTISPECIES: ABC transporter permease [Rhodococcus]|uniref:ABC transporter permease n=1 Tax=Rhodococcus TaxID=1827 RepID=UPI00226CAD12|nr:MULTISPECIES: ABC transporter permease [Rhodococcus]BDB62930.1 diguanylate cyclase [Rhodococcus sp. RDE2]